jgi:hypothetical protein
LYPGEPNRKGTVAELAIQKAKEREV